VFIVLSNKMDNEDKIKRLYINIEELDWDDYIYYMDGKKFNGTGFELFENGNLKTETEFSYGMENGGSKEWYENGQLMDEDNYKLGTKHGLSKSWFENAKIKRESEYELGILTKETVWDENGEKIKDFTLTESDSNYQILLQNRLREPAREKMVREKLSGSCQS
jgi:antitoxin component YwqK of YwqJK toxin-antitoxin module